MERFTHEDLHMLAAERPGPCASIFLATHPGGGEENGIRWRNSLATIRDRLEQQGMRTSDIKQFLAPAHRLMEDVTFWNNTGEGLAAFLAPDFFRTFRLPVRFADQVEVAGRFELKPLLPFATDSRFYVLALGQNGLRLLEGAQQWMSAIDLTKAKGVPANLADTLKFDEKLEMLTFHTRPVGAPGNWGAIFSGHGVGIDDHKKDLLRYFEEINHGLHAILKDEKAPLILAAVEFLWPLYRQVNTYAHLLPQGIPGNPERLSVRELHERAWQIVQPLFARPREEAIALYRQLDGTGRTVHEVAEIIRGAHDGKLETLLLAGDRPCWGSFDRASDQIALHAERQPGDEDLLNFAVVNMLAHHRQVYAMPANRIPDGGLAAAIYCLPLAKRGDRP